MKETRVEFLAAVHVYRRLHEICTTRTIRYPRSVFENRDPVGANAPPDPNCLLLTQGLIVEMTFEDASVPRALLTPWGAWFFSSGNIRFGPDVPFSLMRYGLEIQLFAEHKAHVQGCHIQTTYDVVSVDGLKLPPPILAERASPPERYPIFEDWIRRMRQHVPDYQSQIELVECFSH